MKRSNTFESPRKPESERPTRRILIIEDNFEIRRLMTRVIQRAGHEVVEANNGREALDLLLEMQRGPRTIDLIVLDLMMPIMDGYEFREIQRVDPLISHIPVMVVSADTRASEKKQKLEVSTYLTKPVQIDQFLEALRQELERLP